MTHIANESMTAADWVAGRLKAKAAVRTPTDGLDLNRLEQRYADRLTDLARIGEVAWWRAKPFSIRLSCSRNFYRPDFLVQLADGTLEIHETKGFMEEDALQKLKEVRGLYPFTVRVWSWSKSGGWKERVIA